MIANSSMYNEKQALRYQVDTFKDVLDEHYETLNQAKRQLKEKSRVKKIILTHKIFTFLNLSRRDENSCIYTSAGIQSIEHIPYE
jgi:hypothetical protein